MKENEDKTNLKSNESSTQTQEIASRDKKAEKKEFLRNLLLRLENLEEALNQKTMKERVEAFKDNLSDNKEYRLKVITLLNQIAENQSQDQSSILNSINQQLFDINSNIVQFMSRQQADAEDSDDDDEDAVEPSSPEDDDDEDDDMDENIPEAPTLDTAQQKEEIKKNLMQPRRLI